jgi:pimeloyl-ACP methyl ester carboxylesterase
MVGPCWKRVPTLCFLKEKPVKAFPNLTSLVRPWLLRHAKPFRPAKRRCQSDLTVAACVERFEDRTVMTATPTGLVANATGPTSIFIDWNNVSGASTYKLERWDGSNGTWKQIYWASASQHTDSGSHLQPATTYYYRVRASGATGDSAPSQYISVTTKAALKPDLDPYGVDAPDSALSGATVSVFADIDNLGNAASGSFQVRYYLSSDSNITTGDTLLKTITRGSIAAGTYQQWSENVALPTNATGTFFIGVIADPYNSITESNESNNAQADGAAIVIAPPAKPDLDPYGVDAPDSAFAGATVSVFTDIDNLGNKDSGSFQVRYYLSSDSNITTGDTLLKTTTRGSIAASTYQQWTENITLPKNVTGTFFIGIIADPYNSIAESNESNNAQADGTAIVIAPPAKPDLDPYGVDAPDSAFAGATVSVFTDIDNLGNKDSGSFQVRYYLSSDSNITTGDTLLKSITRGSIAAGTYQQWSENVTLPAKVTGTFFIGVIADPSNTIAESNESNNAQVDGAAITITVLGNYIQERIAVDLPGDNHRADINVFLQRITGDAEGNPLLDANQPILKGVQTWVVIHGRADSLATFRPLAAAIDRYKSGDQVLVLDWSEGAADNHWESGWLDGAAWIPHVAEWAVRQLSSIGVTSDKLFLVGHSWGSFVAYEMAKQMPGTQERLVALDPAASAVEYPHESVDFGAVTQMSWAFYGGGTFGSAHRAGTADEAFRLDYDGWYGEIDMFDSHSAPRHVFESLVRKNHVNQDSDPLRASLFSLARLEGPSTRFLPNAFDGQFEGVFVIQDTNDDDDWGEQWNELALFQYRSAADGQLRSV